MVFAGFTLTTKILSRENFSTCIMYARAIICGRGYGHFVLVRVKIAAAIALSIALSESSLVGSSDLVLTLASILVLMSLLQYFKRAEGSLASMSFWATIQSDAVHRDLICKQAGSSQTG